jgi:LysM repeat protein
MVLWAEAPAYNAPHLRSTRPPRVQGTCAQGTKRVGTRSRTGTRMAPSNSTGGDLVDQLRDWLDRLRDRFAGRRTDVPAPRPSRRISARAQAVPLGSAQARTIGPRQPPERRAGGAERAERSAYTLVFAAVLGVLVLGLFFTLSWILGLGSGSGSGAQPVASPAVSVPAGQLPSPAPLSPSSGLAASPSPSPSPDAGLAAAAVGRVHVVEAGDTLNRLAQRYGVTVDAIMQANSFSDRNRILRIGERLVIPDAASPVPR